MKGYSNWNNVLTIKTEKQEKRQQKMGSIQGLTSFELIFFMAVYMVL